MTVAEAWRRLRESLLAVYEEGEASSIARIVFEDAFGIRNTGREDRLSSQQLMHLSRIESRLLTHEPVQYILGKADFYGLKFTVNSAVLIPRQETEELVHWVLETIGRDGRWVGKRLLDIGTGSACIAVALKKRAPFLVVDAVEISEAALAVARKNAEDNEVDITFFRMDFLDDNRWKQLPGYDLIVSNPPYIPPGEAHLMPENVLAFEPRSALFTADSDPFAFYRAIAFFSGQHLNAGGRLFLEVNEFNAGEIVDLLRKRGFKDCILRQDLSGRDRMVGARKGD